MCVCYVIKYETHIHAVIYDLVTTTQYQKLRVEYMLSTIVLKFLTDG